MASKTLFPDDALDVRNKLRIFFQVLMRKVPACVKPLLSMYLVRLVLQHVKEQQFWVLVVSAERAILMFSRLAELVCSYSSHSQRAAGTVIVLCVLNAFSPR